MAGFAYAGAVVLAAVFVRAAAAKLARPRDAAAGFDALGVPAPAAMAWLVPAAELAVATLLVAVPRAGGVAALVLLVPFTLVLARAVRAGVLTGCACFGSSSRRPVSGRDLVRNGVLAAMALVVSAAAEPRAAVLVLTGVAVAIVAVGWGRRQGTSRSSRP